MNKIAVENENYKGKDSLVNVTNAREARQKRWVAAIVQMNCERKIASKLDKLGVTNYVPIQNEVHQWSDRKKKIGRVVIPMIIFVRLSRDEEDDFRKLPYIIKFVKYPGSKELATPIPDEQIDRLKFIIEHSDSPITFCRNIELGDIIRIKKGPLNGLEGYCCGISNTEIALHIELLGYACVKINTSDIEIIK
mgnify:CR=1 FL=1